MSDAPTRIPSPCTARFTTPSTAPGMPTEEQTCAALRGLVHGWQPVDMPSALPTASQRTDSELDGWRNFARDFSLAELRDKRILGWPTAANDVKDWPTIVALRDELTQMVAERYKSFAHTVSGGAHHGARHERLPRLVRIKGPHERSYSYIDRNGKMRTTYSKKRAGQLRARGYRVM